MVFYTCNKHWESSIEIAWELLIVVVVFVQVKNAQDLESWNGHIVFIQYKTPFTRLDINIAQYFWQWNARTDHVTISYELLSMDNFASFHAIQSYIFSKSSR